jgi:hypothetical protein
MSVTNTDKVLIDWLIDTFGGLLTKRSEKTTIKWGRKPVFTWTATGDRLTHLCEEIYPYVIIKRRQCEIMLKMRATYTGVCSKGKQGVQANSPELLNFRESLMQEMRSLHVRTHSWKND